MSEDFHDNEDRNRFELEIDGATAFVAYRKSPGAITLVHTEVPPELGGRGVGSKLARATLDAVRAQRRKLSVECDFIRSFMSKHPEYNDLLAPSDAAKVDAATSPSPQQPNPE
jgi:predicted GNAT family acetyltransferase